MKGLGKRIRIARENKGLQQSDVEKMMGLTKGIVSNWERDVNSPNLDKLMLLCEALGTEPSYLLDYYGDEVNTEQLDAEAKRHISEYLRLNEIGKDRVNQYTSDMLEIYAEFTEDEYDDDNDDDEEERRLPLFWYPASAGLGVFAGDGNFDRVPVPDDVPMSADFAVRITGHSMEPKIPDGSIVWVRQQSDVDDGEICIATVNDEGYCKVKKGNKLVSINKKYGDVSINKGDTIRITGKVVYIQEQ